MSATDPGTVRELPRLGLLREMTDHAVITEVFARGRVTRAELSTLTGISKPTMSQSVGRLVQAGVLREAGPDTGRRGRTATYYELADDAGWAVGVQIDQRGVHLRSVDLMGGQIDDRHLPLPLAGDREGLIGAVRQAIEQTIAVAAGRGRARAAVLSVANPVDPRTNGIVAMPDSPFPQGEIALPGALGRLIDVPWLVDNDVNLAAVAERDLGKARDVTDFAYVYVGAGMGMALYLAGRPDRRVGRHGRPQADSGPSAARDRLRGGRIVRARRTPGSESSCRSG